MRATYPFPREGAWIAALLLAFALTGARAAVPAPVVLDGSINPVAAATPTASAANPRQPFISRATLKPDEAAAVITFEVALKMRNFADLKTRVDRGEHVSAQELAAKYEPLATDYQMVVDWLTGRGFTIVRQNSPPRAIFVQGSVSQIAQALKVNFARVTLRGKEYTSAVTAPSVPANIAALLVGINGLQPHLHAHTHLVKPNDSGGSGVTYSPSQIAQAYQASGLYSTGITGSGQTIAIVIDTFPAKSDLIAFWNGYGISQSINNIQFIQAVAGTLDAPTGEETLDVEWSSSMAPGAKVRVYAATDLDPIHLDEAYGKVYADATSHPELGIHQMSMSYGSGNVDDTTLSQRQTDDGYFVELTSAGVTCFASSGDGGATPGEDANGTNENGSLQAESPASDPNVIGVGGTSLTSYSNPNATTEVVWNNAANANFPAGASGGGTSTSAGTAPYLNRPTWQTGSGVATGTQRLVPDISCAADPDYGAGYYYTDPTYGLETSTGGTSWASPTCAAFCALINQARANVGLSTPVGQLGPLIYPLIGTANFRDITSGGNDTALSDADYGGVYKATTGYDEATGIGVPLVQTLAGTLAGTQTLLGVDQPSVLKTVNQGQNATIAVTASGSPVGYQWQRMPIGATTWSNLSDNGVYSGSATASLTITDTTTAMSGDQFQCVVSYAGTGALTSSQPAALIVESPWSVTTLAGTAGTTGTPTSSNFNYPTGIAVDSSGNLYVSDLDNNVIRKVTPQGVVTTPYGNLSGTAGSTTGTGNDGTGNSAYFCYPRDITIDSSGTLYVTDEGSNEIRKINTSTNKVTTISLSTSLSDPKGIVVDGSGNIYVADYGNNVIRKITANGTVTTYAGSSTFAAGYANGAATTQALFNGPLGLAIDSSNNIYVTDFGNEVVRKITSQGVVSTVAGQAGVVGCLDGAGTTQALFNVPRGIAVDSSGNLYVTDSYTPIVTQNQPTFTGNDLLRKITSSGVVTTLAGQAGVAGSTDAVGSAAEFYNPAGVAVTSGGTLYVADASNNTIRKGTVAATSVTVSSSPVEGGVVTGGGTFALGSSATVTATANSGFTFSNWNVNGIVVSTSASYTFAVNANTALVANFVAPLAITSAGGAIFALEKAGSFAVTATGYPTPTTFTFTPTSGSLPTGVTFSAAGVFSGTPTQLGSCTGTITVGNGVGANATQSFTLEVESTENFSEWETTNNFTGNSTVTGLSATPENDGVPNLLKYLYNINPAEPMTAADWAGMPVAGMSTIGASQYLTLTYRQYALETGITVNVQTSPDLQNWTTLTLTNTSPPTNTATYTLQPVSTDPTTLDPIMQVEVPFSGTSEFIRLNVTSP